MLSINLFNGRFQTTSGEKRIDRSREVASNDAKAGKPKISRELARTKTGRHLSCSLDPGLTEYSLDSRFLSPSRYRG